MKIALIHDAIDQFGGAERMTRFLLDMYPQADLYTSLVDPEIIRVHFPMLNRKNFYPWRKGKAMHASLHQCVSPFIWRSLNLEKYDVVISNSSHFFCNIASVVKPVHIQYIATPPKNIFHIVPASPLQKMLPYAPIIRKLYVHAIKNADVLMANSKNIKQTLQNIANVQAEVIYPPVIMPTSPPIRHKLKYYLCVSRIENTKGLELPISVCSRLRLPLKIVGSSMDKKYLNSLKSLAGPSVEFLGFLSDSEVAKLYEHTIAFLFPSFNEDFGIAPVEAMAHGVPVIAYYGGGAKETIVDRETGLFFHEYTTQSLENAMQKFFNFNFKTTRLYNHAKLFSEDQFRKKMAGRVLSFL